MTFVQTLSSEIAVTVLQTILCVIQGEMYDNSDRTGKLYEGIICTAASQQHITDRGQLLLHINVRKLKQEIL